MLLIFVVAGVRLEASGIGTLHPVRELEKHAGSSARNADVQRQRIRAVRRRLRIESVAGQRMIPGFCQVIPVAWAGS